MCLSPLRSSNDSLEVVSLREDSSIASLLVKLPSLLEALLLLLVSEHSRVVLERTSSLDLMRKTSNFPSHDSTSYLSSEFWELRLLTISLAASRSLARVTESSLAPGLAFTSCTWARVSASRLLFSSSVRCFTWVFR